MRVIIICGIPISFVVNTFQHGFAGNWFVSSLRIIGAALIVCGFASFTCAKFYESNPAQEEDEKENEIDQSE